MAPAAKSAWVTLEGRPQAAQLVPDGVRGAAALAAAGPGFDFGQSGGVGAAARPKVKAGVDARFPLQPGGQQVQRQGVGTGQQPVMFYQGAGRAVRQGLLPRAVQPGPKGAAQQVLGFAQGGGGCGQGQQRFGPLGPRLDPGQGAPARQRGRRLPHLFFLYAEESEHPALACCCHPRFPSTITL